MVKAIKVQRHDFACARCGQNLYYFGDEVEDLEIECDNCREIFTTDE